MTLKLYQQCDYVAIVTLPTDTVNNGMLTIQTLLLTVSADTDTGGTPKNNTANTDAVNSGCQ